MVTHSRQSVFQAIASSARRGLIQELSRGPRIAGVLASRFPETRPAVARHLRVLREAGLVSVRRSGRNRVYELRPAPLRAVRDWLARYERFWTDRLEELAEFVEAEKSEKRRKP
jgi:DNA-binding transcriptional ArsR family regulator